MPQLELKLGSIPLRIEGRFLLMALLLGLNERDPARLAIWVVIVVVSVVVHELGHALVGKAFGLSPSIALHGMGGATMFEGGRTEMSTAKSIAISVAGPFAGFLFALVLYGIGRAGVHPEHPLARHAASVFFWVNVAWGIFNLLPMLPLDGGNVLRSVLRAFSRTHGEKIARVVSIVIAAGIGLWAVRGQQWWILYLGVLYGFQNVQALRTDDRLRVDETLAEAIKLGQAALDRDEPRAAIALLGPALAATGASELRPIGLRVFIIGLVRDERWREAMVVIERERDVLGPEELGRYADGMRDLGRDEEAARIDLLVRAPATLGEFRA